MYIFNYIYIYLDNYIYTWIIIYIYLDNYIYIHTWKTKNPKFPGHYGKKRNIQFFLSQTVFTCNDLKKLSNQKNIAVLPAAKPYFVEKHP